MKFYLPEKAQSKTNEFPTHNSHSFSTQSIPNYYYHSLFLFCFSTLHLFRAFLHPLLLLKIFHKNLVNKSVIETWNFGKSQNNFIVRTSSGCFCFVYLFVLFPHILSLSPNSPSLFLFPHILSLFLSLHILSLSLTSHPSILAKVLQ